MAHRTIGLYGPTGSGKTTLAGELAKAQFKQFGTRARLHAADMGGFESLRALIQLGIIKVNKYDGHSDPWLWVNESVSHKPDPDIGLEIYDSATSVSEAILSYIAKSDMKVGAQNTQKFTVSKGANSIQVGSNNMNHFGIVQTFMLDMIWKSTWLAEAGPDVLWTFSLDGGEDALEAKIAGPKLAGHALTAAVPKWFQYFFRTAVRPPNEHILYLSAYEENGITGMGNSRYPLDATTPLPDSLCPASLVEALALIEQGQDEALENLRMECGL